MTTTHEPIFDPSIASSPVTITIAEGVGIATLLVCSASVGIAALGDPELMALVACVGLVVFLLGLTILRADHYRGGDTPSLVDDGPLPTGLSDTCTE